MLSLLYVDDDDALRDLVRFALETDPGLELHIAASGRQALDLCDAVRPDAVLLDAMMPDMDGPGVLAALRANPEHAGRPVIFITARAMPEERARLLALGAAGVITKPFDPMGLAGEIRRILETAR